MKICNVEALRMFVEANLWEPINPIEVVFLLGAERTKGKVIGVNPDYDRVRVEFETNGRRRRLMVSRFDVVEIMGEKI